MPRTILLADDSLTIRKVVELAFSDTDFRVEAVADGREALERLSAIRPDLVLADVVMPAPSGYELCRRVKESDRPVPVLLLAGAFEPFDEHMAQACGADGHLVKPFESRVLLQKVRSLIERPEPSAATTPRETVERAPESVEQFPADVAAETVSGELTSAQLERLTRAVVERLSDRIVREIAWEVVPELAELIVRERLRELETERSREET